MYARISKIASIETLRVISIMAVICLHTRPFSSLGLDNVYFKFLFHFIDNLCRFAVPFFFIAFGYFFGRKLRPIDSLKNSYDLFFKNLKRYSVILFIWYLIYTIIPKNIPFRKIAEKGLSYDYVSLFRNNIINVFGEFRGDPLNFIIGGGPSSPLWFLSALIIALIIVFVFYIVRKEEYLYPVAIFLYILGLFAGRYSATPLGIHLPFDLNTRDGPFFSTIFVSLGFWLSKKNVLRLKTWVILLLIFSGFLLQEIEALFLWRSYKVAPIFDYLFGTLPFSAGIFLFALLKPNIGRSTFIAKLAPLTLGIYVVHSLVISFCQKLACFVPVIVWQFLFPLIVFIFSALIVVLLKKARLSICL